MNLRILCIVKLNRTSAHERIDKIGGVNGDGTRWSLTQPQAILDIDARKHTFYVEQPVGHRVDVIIAKTTAGHRYLKTVSDGEQPNNLLSLPDCP